MLAPHHRLRLGQIVNLRQAAKKAKGKEATAIKKKIENLRDVAAARVDELHDQYAEQIGLLEIADNRKQWDKRGALMLKARGFRAAAEQIAEAYELEIDFEPIPEFGEETEPKETEPEDPESNPDNENPTDPE